MTTPVPEDFHTITPQLAVKGVADAIGWRAATLPIPNSMSAC